MLFSKKIFVASALLGGVMLGAFAFTYSVHAAEEKKPEMHKHNHKHAPARELTEEEKKKQEAILKKVEKITREELLSQQKSDVVIGSKDAPVTLIEYASFSCGHCATFANEIYPVLKEEYIDKGKVKMYFRDFPLNLPALKASMLVSCAEKDKKEAFKKTIFKTQEKWAFEKDFEEKLKNIAKIGGMDEEKFKTCTASKELEEEILVERLAAAKILEVTSTPTIIINGEKVAATDVEALRKKLDALLEGAATKGE